MKKMRLLFVLILVLGLTLQVSASETRPINTCIDGEAVSFTTDPIVVDDILFLPLRELFENLGYTVKWDNATKSILCEKTNKKIYLQKGSNTARVNDSIYTLESMLMEKDGVTLIPLKEFSELTKSKGKYDIVNKMALITTEGTVLKRETTKLIIQCINSDLIGKSDASASEFAGVKYYPIDLYGVPGTGKNAGGLVIKGMANSDRYEVVVFYKKEGSVESLHYYYNDKQQPNMDEVFYWKKDGVPQSGSRRWLYSYFNTLASLGCSTKAEFGNYNASYNKVLDEWFMNRTMDTEVEFLVNDFLYYTPAEDWKVSPSNYTITDPISGVTLNYKDFIAKYDQYQDEDVVFGLKTPEELLEENNAFDDIFDIEKVLEEELTYTEEELTYTEEYLKRTGGYVFQDDMKNFYNLKVLQYYDDKGFVVHIYEVGKRYTSVKDIALKSIRIPKKYRTAQEQEIELEGLRMKVSDYGNKIYFYAEDIIKEGLNLKADDEDEED